MPPEEAPATEQDQPTDQPDAPETDQQTEDQTESFTDFDTSQIPEFESVDEARDWIGERYGQMNRDYTQKTQGLGEVKRTAEESQALIEGLRDPSTMPHYLRLLGVDLTDPTTLDLLGFDLADDEGLDDLDEPDLESEVTQLKQQIAQDREEREMAAQLQALDDLADTELEAIEDQWGRKLDEDEDMFLRREAESNPRPDGLPDYEMAAKRLKGFLGRREKEWAKQRSEPGRGAPGGKPGGKALDPNKEEDRIALAAQAAERAMASQS